MITLTIAPASKSDLPAILGIQKEAFWEVARVFHLKTLPPLEQTLESVTGEFENGTILKACLVLPSSIKQGDTNDRIADKSKFPDSDLRTLKDTPLTGGTASGNDNNKIIIVGSVRAYRDGDTCHIGKLVVLPEYQNQGIGKALMNAIENHYKIIVRRYELFTGIGDPRNRYLYDGLGYKPFKTEKLNEQVTFVYMEKSVILNPGSL